LPRELLREQYENRSFCVRAGAGEDVPARNWTGYPHINSSLAGESVMDRLARSRPTWRSETGVIVMLAGIVGQDPTVRSMALRPGYVPG
jgi:hypothetical protein